MFIPAVLCRLFAQGPNPLSVKRKKKVTEKGGAGEEVRQWHLVGLGWVEGGGGDW